MAPKEEVCEADFEPEKLESVRIKINGKWLELSAEFVAQHPGGSLIYQYRDADATDVFHAFHEGAPAAYKQLALIEKTRTIEFPGEDPTLKATPQPSEINVGAYEYTIEEEKKIVRSFGRLRERVEKEGLLNEVPSYYFRKIGEAAAFLFSAIYLQYISSALCMAFLWQQLGWLTHEFCHHQFAKNRRLNDALGLVFGNFLQGFSRDWWKDKHNTHHAATNIIDQDGDIDLAPLVAMVPDDLKKYKQPLEQFFLKFIPYQHLYFTLMLPLLRFSWTSQSLIHVFTAPGSQYKKDQQHALAEQIALLGHWAWVLFQLYMLPSNGVRFMFFAISQVLSGLMIAVVVTYNHNSVEKFPEHSRLLNNFVCLQLFTTRNMHPGVFTDWFWGGLNYQVEHHLFPTMPRPFLNRCSKLVKEFCAENNLPYLVDDYMTGYMASLRLLENVSKMASKRTE